MALPFGGGAPVYASCMKRYMFVAVWMDTFRAQTETIPTGNLFLHPHHTQLMQFRRANPDLRKISGKPH